MLDKYRPQGPVAQLGRAPEGFCNRTGLVCLLYKLTKAGGRGFKSHPARINQRKKMTEEFKITQHALVPEHIKLNQEEAKKVLETYNVSSKQLPKIYINDPAIKELSAKIGDIIKIKRASPTVKTMDFYRVVINE